MGFGILGFGIVDLGVVVTFHKTGTKSGTSSSWSHLNRDKQVDTSKEKRNG